MGSTAQRSSHPGSEPLASHRAVSTGSGPDGTLGSYGLAAAHRLVMVLDDRTEPTGEARGIASAMRWVRRGGSRRTTPALGPQPSPTPGEDRVAISSITYRSTTGLAASITSSTIESRLFMSAWRTPRPGSSRRRDRQAVPALEQPVAVIEQCVDGIGSRPGRADVHRRPPAVEVPPVVGHTWLVAASEPDITADQAFQ